MPKYNNVTFYIKAEGMTTPDWNRQKFSSTQHYPDTNLDERQFGGMSNLRVALNVFVYTQADVDALEASWGDTGRDLIDLSISGTTISGVMLVDVGGWRRPPLGMVDEVWEGTLVFERESA